jgi:integrase
MKRAGPLRIRFHDLRHTFATVLLYKRTHPEIVQEEAVVAMQDVMS